jgi:hypothetical protein
MASIYHKQIIVVERVANPHVFLRFCVITSHAWLPAAHVRARAGQIRSEPNTACVRIEKTAVRALQSSKEEQGGG